jgi:valyl-tRNA synthetase
MSKSLGNSPDPLDLIGKFGADALRFGVMRSAPLGQDILFDEKNVELGRNFCTKLWNAARFRQMQSAAAVDGESGSEVEELEGEINASLLTSDDKWILLRLDAAIASVTKALEEYRFSDAANALYAFFWSEYCDWYVEASKASLQPAEGVENPRRANTLAVMDFVLSHALRLFHPFLPFITEELWQNMGFAKDMPPKQGGESIMYAPWPKAFTPEEREYFTLDESDERLANAKYEVVTAGRALRRDCNIASNKRVRFVLRRMEPLPSHDRDVLALLLNTESFEIVDEKWAPATGTPTALTPLGNLFLPLEGLIDAGAERERLGKEIAKVEAELAKVRAKLADENFAAKVPAKVLEEHRQREADWAAKHAQLAKMLAGLGG